MLVAGIDSSTQSCKVLICEAGTGAVVRSGKAPHPEGTEVDPEAWWHALQTAIAEAGGLDDVTAVSIGGQQHGMVALDEAGAVIRPALLWNDTRSAGAAADLRSEVGAEEYVRRTGLVPVASFTATKLRWLARHEPENAARLRAVALPHDWLTWRLRGYGPGSADLGELITDRSDASGTGYFDPTSNTYDHALLARALERAATEGITLPRVLGPAESVPGPGWLAAAGAGDNAAAALGLGLVPGDVAVSIGTSGTAFASSPSPVADPSGTVAGFADASGKYLPIVTTLNAARVLDAVAALLGVGHDELAALALTADPGAGGLVLQPWFEGERTPNLPEAKATLFNMTLTSTTRANLARAAIEGVLCSLAFGVDQVRSHGAAVNRILLIGGAAQNPAVQQIAAQVFDAAIVVPEPGEYVARGAARQAAWAATGEPPNWDLPVQAELPPAHEPSIRAAYDALLPPGA